MPSSYQILSELVPVLFVFAFGACIGSLINVLVYRMPRGLNVVFPSSACPSCSTKLTWRENFPILGWLILRGRCRFCKAKISPEYPIVEAMVALLFVTLWLFLFGPERPLGIPLQDWRPEWALNGFARTWPIFIVWLVLFSSLVAMTLIDARTYQIPMVLTWVPTLVALAAHTLTAAVGGRLAFIATDWTWAIASPGPNHWWWIGLAGGSVLGLGLANLLVHKKVFSRSFEDYEAWEAREIETEKSRRAAAGEPPLPEDPNDPGAGQPEMWIQYPHARREMLKELVFLSCPIGLGLVGGWAAFRLTGPYRIDPNTNEALAAIAAPLWVQALAGVVLGYLIGGLIVWGVRILGSLAFGREAMGLGDVHLLGAIGACVGAVDAALAFLAATVLGVLWPVLAFLTGGKVKRALPFGPYLAAGTLLVQFAKPWIERLLAHAWPGFVLPNLP